MAVQELPFSVQPLRRSFHTARRRLWLQTGSRTLARSLAVALGFALAAALLALFRAPEPVRAWLWTAAILMPLGGLVTALLQRPSESRAVRLLDLQLGLRQKLGTAHELLSTRSEGPLVRWQLAQASDLAEELAVSRAFPLLPRRELLAALLLAAGTAVCLELASLGITIPNPLSAVQLPGITREAPRAADRPLFSRQKAPDGTSRQSPALDSTRQLLSEIQKQTERGTLSRQATANAVQQANAELNKAAQLSRIQQEALDNLAVSLRNTAIGSDAAQSLRQGEYDRAAQQLRDLGQQLDQLSPAARQQLTDALNNASSQSQGVQSLARAESRAAQTVARGDSSNSNRSMDRLAQAVQDAGNQVISQSELADTWQQLDAFNKQVAADAQGTARPPGTPQVAPGPEGSGQRATGLQLGQDAGGQSPQGDPQAALAGGTSDSIQAAGSGGAPGNTRGGPALGDANPRLGPDGKPADLQGRTSGQFSGQPDDGAAPPSVTREGEGSSTGTGADQLGAASSVPAENVFVPGDRRSIVRDFFSGGAGSQ